MTDLTKLTTPFGLLDPETQNALKDWGHGVERYRNGKWEGATGVGFISEFTYRARPAPLVPDTIDWSHVAPEWKWMARDEDGGAWLHKSKPFEMVMRWDSHTYSKIDAFASYRRGTVDWQDSRVQRPE